MLHSWIALYEANAHIFDSHTLVIRIFRQFLTAIWRIILMMTGKTLSFSPQIGSISNACLHLITQTNSHWSLLVVECVLCYVIIWGNRNAIQKRYTFWFICSSMFVSESSEDFCCKNILSSRSIFNIHSSHFCLLLAKSPN